MKYLKYIALGAATMLLGMSTACVGDLNVDPDDPNNTTELTTSDQWYGYFGSLYGNLIYEGNLTPNGVDGGAGVFTRCHWNLQEITADEAIILNTWNDPGYADLKYNTWTSNNTWEYMCFQREATSARRCIEFLQQVDAAKDCGISETEIEHWKAEAHVLHALNYYYMIDLFGKGPWVDENTEIGGTPPTYSRTELFEATVNELLDAINGGNLVPAAQQEYGRLSKEAARMLLAKLYLNAKVYTGTAMYSECAAQIKEILKTINTLAPTYKYLFCEGNQKYCGNGEIIWSIPSNSVSAQTYGGTTYLTAAAYFATVPDDVLKMLGNPNSIWNGLKTRPELVDAFSANDQRYLFYEGQFQNSVQNLNNFDVDSDGYMCIKYRLTTEDDYDNTANNSHSIVFANIDYPLFRLADAYLMLTECQLNGVSDADPSFEYFNKVRERAGLYALSSVSENDLLKERQCELYWEGHRRSDLIRFNRYVGSTYLWSWKGGVYDGTSISSNRTVFAIPYQYVSTVGQNEGY